MQKIMKPLVLLATAAIVMACSLVADTTAGCNAQPRPNSQPAPGNRH